MRPEELGKRLFRLRGYLGVPLFLAAIALAKPNPLLLALGLASVLVGEGIRVLAVSYAGPTTRSKEIQAPALITWGPYAWTRNPIYWGNFFVGLGMMLSAGVAWLSFVYIPLFWVEYYLIVKAEEEALLGLFGREYEAYARSVPRFGIKPRKTTWRDARPLIALRAERSTFLVIGAYYLALGLRWLL